MSQESAYRERSQPKREMHVTDSKAGGVELLMWDMEATRFGVCPGGFGLALMRYFLYSHSSLLEW